MAAQGSSDVRIFSSVRPLQIQRSFEGPAEASEIAGSVTREVTIEKQSSVSITSQTSSSSSSSSTTSSSMSGVNQPSPATNVSPPGGASPASPGAVVIRSSAAGEASGAPRPQAVAGQNVVIVKSAGTVVASTGSSPQQQPVPPSPAQGQGGQSVVIRSGAGGSQAIQQSAPNKIVINPSPIAQSRVTVVGAGGAAGVSPPSSPPPPAAAPHQDGPVVYSNEESTTTTLAQAVVVHPQRRSSITIKSAHSPPPPPPPPTVPTTTSTAAEAPPHHPSVVVDRVVEPHDQATAGKGGEDLSEKVHPKKPVGPSFDEVFARFDVSTVFYVALAVVVASLLCIVGEGEVPLSWILTAVSFASFASFATLQL